MALSRHHAAISRPLSVEEITDQAGDFEFSTNRPLKGWLRSAQMLLTEAAICEQDGNLQTAYLYLLRHAELVVGKFPEHPESKDPKYKSEIAQAMKTVQKNLSKLEQWKPKIKQDYQRYVKAMERRNAERQRVQDALHDDQLQRLADEERRRDSIGSDDGDFDHTMQALDANEHRDLAVDLAHREIRRRDATRQSTRQAGISPGTVASRRRGVVMDSHDNEDDAHRNDGVSESIRETGRYLYPPGQQASRQIPQSWHGGRSSSYQYPSVPAKEETIDWKRQSLQPQRTPTTFEQPPSLPTKIPIHTNQQQPPALPPKTTTSPPSPPPAILRPQSKYIFQPTASTESGQPLRTLLLPSNLRTTFLNIAHPQTLQNLETGAILCGTLISNALFISYLIIPDQHSTSDTCDTTEAGDNDLFDYCDSHDLLVCGWIHTHPSQSCFLSSRDLHTSAGYQVMLPEAVAIVCAPRQMPDWGIFRLTDPPGLKSVLACERKGLFHPHDVGEGGLYTDALKPGHVVEAEGLEFSVVDLRKK